MTDPVLDMLLAAVIAHPDDDGPRLAYADRCLELGYDDRAEFIRVQCESPRMEPGPARVALYRRERALLRALRPALRAELPPALPGCHAWGLYTARHADGIKDEFCIGLARGFAAFTTLPCDAWLSHGPALVRAAPLGAVRLTDLGPFPFPPAGPPQCWRWFRNVLPAALWPHYLGVAGVAPAGWEHATRAAADSALSATCLAWARSVAPPPPAPVN